MKSLIHFELRKLFKSKSFYVCLLVSLLLVLLNALLIKSIADANGASVDPNSSLLQFASNGMLTMILAIFTAIFISEDFSCGSIKNVYAKGYSRNEVYFAKYIVTLIFGLIFLLLDLLGSFLISRILLKGDSVENTTLILSLFLQCVVVEAYNTLFFVITIISGKLGISVAFNILGPSLVSLLLSLLDSFLELEKIRFSDYWLEAILSSLQVVNCTKSSMIISLVVSFLVIAITTIIGTRLHKKKEF